MLNLFFVEKWNSWKIFFVCFCYISDGWRVTATGREHLFWSSRPLGTLGHHECPCVGLCTMRTMSKRQEVALPHHFHHRDKTAGGGGSVNTSKHINKLMGQIQNYLLVIGLKIFNCLAGVEQYISADEVFWPFWDKKGQNFTSYTAKLQEVKVSLTVCVDALLHQLPLLGEMCTDWEKQNQSSLIWFLKKSILFHLEPTWNQWWRGSSLTFICGDSQPGCVSDKLHVSQRRLFAVPFVPRDLVECLW